MLIFFSFKPLNPIFWLCFIIFVILKVGFHTHLNSSIYVSCVAIKDSKILLSTHSDFLKFNDLYKLNRHNSNNWKDYVGNLDLKSKLYQMLIGNAFRLCFVANKNIYKQNHQKKYQKNKQRNDYRTNLMPEEDEYKSLKELYLNRDKYFDESLGKNCNLYRYFNITKKNIKKHLNYTMDEFFKKREEDSNKSVYLVDGNAFNGKSEWSLPLPRSMTSYKIPEVGSDLIVPIGSENTNIEPKFDNEVLDEIYKMIPDENDSSDKYDEDTNNTSVGRDVSNNKDNTEDIENKNNDKTDLIELYDEVGDNDYQVFEDCKVYTKEFFQDVKLTSDEESKRKRELLRRVMRHPTVFPCYLDPENPLHRTGRRREIQRKRDSGRLQRLRWKMDVDYEDDIARGNWTRGDDIAKEFNDSIEWEQLMPTHQDNNYFKRSYYEGGFGDEDRTVDNYFDVQFIGSTDAYPFAVSAGMQFTWPIYWVPWLCKKNPKRRGQPIRSQVFNLGGIEPLQLWFYPEGTAHSDDGYCSLKLVSPPGWNLPYRIYLYIFSEYNRVVLGPMYRESSEYVSQSLNTCRLVSKKNKELLEKPENDKDYVILGPSGNVYVGVGVVDEPIRKHKQKFDFKYDWDEGDYDFNQWLKKQTSNPDDRFTMENIEKDRTHSIWYESHKYRHVPDRHISRYWKTRYNDEIDWNPPIFN